MSLRSSVVCLPNGDVALVNVSPGRAAPCTFVELNTNAAYSVLCQVYYLDNGNPKPTSIEAIRQTDMLINLLLTAVAPFSFVFGSDFIKENLTAEKRTELAVVAQNRRMDLAQEVAERTIRLQASNVDMDQTLAKAQELSRVNGDFVIQSKHQTAVVRRRSPCVGIRR